MLQLYDQYILYVCTVITRPLPITFYISPHYSWAVWVQLYVLLARTTSTAEGRNLDPVFRASRGMRVLAQVSVQCSAVTTSFLTPLHTAHCSLLTRTNNRHLSPISVHPFYSSSSTLTPTPTPVPSNPRALNLILPSPLLLPIPSLPLLLPITLSLLYLPSLITQAWPAWRPLVRRATTVRTARTHPTLTPASQVRTDVQSWLALDPLPLGRERAVLCQSFVPICPPSSPSHSLPRSPLSPLILPLTYHPSSHPSPFYSP